MTTLSRHDSITLEQAKKRFNEYYEERNDSDIGILRGKMFDMMYQKTKKKVLKPGEPGSARYLLYKEAPRYLDMEGVDSFDEGIFPYKKSA